MVKANHALSNLAQVKMSGSEKIEVNMNTENKIFGKHYDNSSIKIICNWEVWRFSRTKRHCSRAKQLQRKTKKGAARANLFFLLIRKKKCAVRLGANLFFC